jgi:hypothetical protein
MKANEPCVLTIEGDVVCHYLDSQHATMCIIYNIITKIEGGKTYSNLAYTSLRWWTWKLMVVFF